MRLLRQIVAVVLILHFIFTPVLLAQPVILPQTPFGGSVQTGITNLRIVSQSPDGTEIVLAMDYSYDGMGGTTAKLLPLFEKKGQKEVSSWFGADPVTVGRGKGLVSLKAKYFNDEAGVPPEVVTDRVFILVINQTGTIQITRVPF